MKFENVGKIDNMAKGIYRYINSENNIIYIGKGNIKARAKIPQRIEWGICLIEYSIVEDNDTAYKWEEYYLQKYVERHGVKPAFNVVMGHHQDED